MITSADDPGLKTFQRIMVDANVAISYLDSSNKFHTKVRKRIQELYADGATFFYAQPALLEIKNYWRRKLISECIQAHLDQGNHLYGAFLKAYLKFRPTKTDDILNDPQIKKLRETLEPIFSGKGVTFWFKLCQQAFSGEFKKLDGFLNAANFKYAKFYDEDVYPVADKSSWPVWDEVDVLMEKYGLGSNDAAILNMVNGGKNIDAFLSNDGDLLFSIAKGAMKPNVRCFTFLNYSC
jgi:predicted nucleic acid-binding protein